MLAVTVYKLQCLRYLYTNFDVGGNCIQTLVLEVTVYNINRGCNEEPTRDCARDIKGVFNVCGAGEYLRKADAHG